VIQNESDFYPFGGEYQVTLNLANQHYKFTGKERDTESVNDYFGARYYSSRMGRFMSPDWSAKEDPVPYAKLDNPQSLNLYAYVGNSPLARLDPDGHLDCKAFDGNSAACIDAAFHAGGPADGTWTIQAQQKNQGVPVVKPGGNTVPDSNSSTNQMMSPTTNLQPVADAGKAVGEHYAELMKKSPLLAGAYLLVALNHYVGHGGVFDYQRSGNAITGYDQLRQFRDVSNFNVGLFTRSAGLSLEQTMNMTRFIGSMSNYGSAPLGPNGVPARTEEFIRLGYSEAVHY
jgi:RHS repeat-associated protein